MISANYAAMIFKAGEGSVTLNLTDGTVELSPGLTLDEGALLFWRQLALAYPTVKQEMQGEVGREMADLHRMLRDSDRKGYMVRPLSPDGVVRSGNGPAS